MYIKVGQRIFSSTHEPFVIRLPIQEIEEVVKSYEAMKNLKDSDKPDNYVLISFPEALEEHMGFEEMLNYVEDFDLKNLCTCGFCACTKEDRARAMARILDEDAE